MLTRSTNREAGSSAERIQLAATFGLLGTILGILGLALVFWLGQLNSRVHEQRESIQSLARSVEQVASGQRLATDTLVEKVVGENPKAFLERYERAAKARDDAQRQLVVQRTINDTLGSRAKELETHASELQAELEKTRYSLEQYKKDAEELPKLRERIAGLDDLRERHERQLAELGPWLDSDDGKQAVTLVRELSRTRTLSYVGWGCTALLGLGLVAAYIYFKPLAEDAPTDPGHTPHRIQ
jgi:hypothetical protein